MSVENHFQTSEEIGAAYIGDYIIAKLPSEERIAAGERAEEIVKKYEGQDIHALFILSLAAEQGKFEEFAVKLEKFHEENLGFVHPEVRKVGLHSETEIFFLECHDSLGIKPMIAREEIYKAK